MVAKDHSVDVPRSAALASRHDDGASLLSRAAQDPTSHLAANAMNLARGRARVCLDLRSLPEDAINGTGVYAVELARALRRASAWDLVVAAETEGQRRLLSPLDAPVYLPEETLPAVQVTHRPAQVFAARHLPLLLRSSGALVITYQDLIAYRAASTHSSAAAYERYRAVSRLSVRAAQQIIAISEHTRKDIAREFDLDERDIPVVYHGVDREILARSDDARDDAALRGLAIDGPFFLCVGSDYAHKNLRMLLAAYAALRHGWRTAAPLPSLVLVGHPSGTIDGAFAALQTSTLPGVSWHRGVDAPVLHALLRRATALVFPSVYEGFGLPPLEAMAAGTPVVCAAFTSVPEVVGDAALVVAPLTDQALADAMLRVATDTKLSAAMRESGRARAARFTWDATAQATIAAYERAVRAPSERSLKERAFAAAMLDSLAH
jgi:glycosyltransferase involved in cell wall biosynthesis